MKSYPKNFYFFYNLTRLDLNKIHSSTITAQLKTKENKRAADILPPYFLGLQITISLTHLSHPRSGCRGPVTLLWGLLRPSAPGQRHNSSWSLRIPALVPPRLSVKAGRSGQNEDIRRMRTHTLLQNTTEH